MKVAFITHYTTLYGANRSLLDLIEGLMPLGVEPFVVIPDNGEIVPYLKDLGVPFYITPHQTWVGVFVPKLGRGIFKQYFRWWKDVFSKIRKNIHIIPNVVHKFKEWDVDIIYSNSSVIPLGAIAAIWMRKPHVWHIREFGDLDYNLTYDWGNFVTNYIFRKSDSYICVSKAICSHYASRLKNNRCHVVYNGVATLATIDKLTQYPFFKHKDNKFVFSLVGLIHPCKGQETAIRALGILNKSFAYDNVQLMIVGGGDVKTLKELAVEIGVSERVAFLGYTENPFNVYLLSDVVLMCSKNEGMGRVTAEAMVAGRPVIAYNGGGTVELVLHELNGLLYEGKEEALSKCMRRVIENPEWAKEMGKNGSQLAKDKYTIEIYAENIFTILSDLLVKKNKSTY